VRANCAKLLKTVINSDQKVKNQAGMEGALRIVALLRCLSGNLLLPFGTVTPFCAETTAGRATTAGSTMFNTHEQAGLRAVFLSKVDKVGRTESSLHRMIHN